MNKNKLLIVLMFLISGLAEANLILEPVKIPVSISDEKVLNIVESAAKHRGWTVLEVDKERLTVNIVRRGYDSTLEFFVENKQLQFIDDTTARIRLPRKARNKEGLWRESAVPVDWVNTIISDVNNRLISGDEDSTKLELASAETTIGPGCEKQLSAKTTEKRLESLKRMYKKKLINRSEYENKKSEILSCF